MPSAESTFSFSFLDLKYTSSMTLRLKLGSSMLSSSVTLRMSLAYPILEILDLISSMVQCFMIREKNGGYWRSLLQRMQLLKSWKYFSALGSCSPLKRSGISSPKYRRMKQLFTPLAFYSQKLQRSMSVYVMSSRKAFVIVENQTRLGMLGSRKTDIFLIFSLRHISISTPQTKAWWKSRQASSATPSNSSAMILICLSSLLTLRLVRQGESSSSSLSWPVLCMSRVQKSMLAELGSLLFKLCFRFVLFILLLQQLDSRLKPLSDPYFLAYFTPHYHPWQQQFQSKQKMFTRTREVTPSAHQYRSVKYKVTQDSNAPLLPASDFQTVEVKQMSRTFHTSWGRGSRYSMRKDQRRELFTAEMPEDAANDTKLSYMNTLDKLFLSSERRPNSSRKDGKTITLRVSLPNIVDCEPSLFTSLEPMSQPLDFIERNVQTLRKEMAAHKMQISQLHHNIQAIRSSILGQLEQTKKQGERQMERLSKLLKADSVEFQESQLRFRRQCGELRKGDDNLRRNFQAVKQRESSLQSEIFSSRPFELVRNEQLSEQFPQEYF